LGFPPINYSDEELTMSMKKAYEEKMDAQIREWSAKIDVLKAKAEKANAEQKIKYNEKIESIQAKRKKLENKMDELRNSGEEAWEEFRGGVEQAWEELKNAVERAGDKFQ